MKRFGWYKRKARWLKANGRPSFRAVIRAIRKGGLIDDRKNTAKGREGQRVLAVWIRGYIHRVPYTLRQDGKYFLWTVHPWGKEMRKHRRFKREEE